MKIKLSILSALALLTGFSPAMASTPEAVNVFARSGPELKQFATLGEEPKQADPNNAEAQQEEVMNIIEQKLAKLEKKEFSDLQKADKEQLAVPGPELMGISATLSSSPIIGLRLGNIPRNAFVIPASGMRIIAKDNSENGSLYVAAMTIAKDSLDRYVIGNLYNWGKQTGYTPPVVNIDASTGKVSIPSQQILLHSTYGSIWMVPLRIENGKYYYSLDPIEGTIAEDGTISLPSWGIMVPEGEKAGALFNVFVNSDWKQSNLSINSQSAVDSDIIESWGLIEQPSNNEIALYNIDGYNYGEVLYATLTSAKTAKMSPQKVLNNALLGPYYAYSITIEDKIKVNAKSPIIINFTSDSTLVMGSWGVVCQASNNYYLDLYTNSILTTNFKINWPERHEANFEGNGTEGSPYLIKTANDLAVLSECVGENRNDYATAYYALTGDIDFATISYGFSPIGDEAAPFAGVFDGKGHTIKNFSYNGRGFQYAALFGNTTAGQLRNVNFENVNVTSSGEYIGSLVALNGSLVDNVNVQGTITGAAQIAGGIAGQSTNYISNSTFKGNVSSIGDVGGIVGDAFASIKKCSTECNLVLNGFSSLNHMLGGIVGSIMFTTAVNREAYVVDCNTSGYFQDAYGKGMVGGVVGLLGNGARVITSFNTAALSAQRLDGTDSDTSTGGVVAWAAGGEITDCYNAGTIVKTGKSNNVGGIIGYISVSYVFSAGSTTMQNQCYVTNCINTGQIISTPEGDVPTKGILGNTYVYTGFDPIGECINNCYSDTQVSIHKSNVYAITTDALTSGSLPQGFSSSIWEAKPGYYPTLKSNCSTTAANLSSAAMLLTGGENVRKVKKNFTVSAPDKIKWNLYYNGSFSANTDALKVAGNNVSIKDKYSNEILVAIDEASGFYKMYRVAVVPKAFQGEGTETNPYLISNIDDFKNLHTAIGVNAQPHEGDYFRMTQDIDFANAQTNDFYGVGYGYVPSYYFGGIFDGGNHKISNFKYDAVKVDADGKALNTSTYYTGFFNAIGPEGTVKNLVIDSNCEFKGYYCNGSVAGFAYGRIENCINHAPVTTVYMYGGGIVGYTDEMSVLEKCYNDGTVTQGHSYVGGIVGGLVGKAVLCQNDGNVQAYRINPLFNDGIQQYAGGISGGTAVEAVIDRCVNQGNISAFASVGGITGSGIGTLYKGCISNGLLKVNTAVPTIGAIIGKVSGVNNIAENCYFDASVIPNDACNSASLTGATPLYTGALISGKLPEGLSADDFQASPNAYPVVKAFAGQESSKAMSALYIGFADKQTASNIQQTTTLSSGEGIKWTLKEKEEGEKAYFSIADGKLHVSIPTDMQVGTDVLTASKGDAYSKVFDIQTVPVLFAGTGTETDPYQLKNVADLNTLADFIYKSNYDYANTHFKVMNDIDFQGDTLNIIAKGETAQFNGYFHGDNRTIKGFVYENTSVTNTAAKPHPLGYKGYHMGFFGKVGSLGRVENLIVDGKITLYQYAGGIVGDLYGTVKGCTFKGEVGSTATSGYNGGIASRVYSGGTIDNCTYQGKMSSGNASYNGGFAYIVYEGGKVTNSVNKGYMDSKNCGGMVYQLAGELLDCTTDSTASFSMAGITVGGVYTAIGNARISGCKNYADISSNTLQNIGGIVSSTSTSSATAANIIVENCVNYGNITGKGYSAGIITRAYRGTTIRNCENYGIITATGASYCGGVAACLETATDALPIYIEDCNNYGEVKGWQSYIGGVTGKIGTKNFATRLVNHGKVSSNVNTGTSHLAVGGVTGSLNGELTCSYNTGDINTEGHGTGGITGLIQSGLLDRCFNLGNVSSTAKINYNMGCVGGLVGYSVTAGTISNCYNMGTLYAPKHLSGMVARFNSAAEYYFENCYNNGAVTWGDGPVPETTSNVYVRGVSGTVVHHSNLYYNNEVNTFTATFDPSGRGRSTRELMDVELGEEWIHVPGTLPVLKYFADNYEALVAAVEILFTREGDHKGNVNNHVYLGAPKEDLIYTASDHFQQNSSNKAKFHTVKTGNDAWIKVSSPDGKYEKTFNLVVNSSTGIEEVDSDYVEIVNVEYFDFTGNRIAEPAKGTLCIVRTTFADGKVETTKRIIK